MVSLTTLLFHPVHSILLVNASEGNTVTSALKVPLCHLLLGVLHCTLGLICVFHISLFFLFVGVFYKTVLFYLLQSDLVLGV
jgi:hypothetical protein